MDIQKYEAFIKTAELGSIKKASEALGYTQAGLSYIIKTLEEELDISFAITAKSISLAAARSCSLWHTRSATIKDASRPVFRN